MIQASDGILPREVPAWCRVGRIWQLQEVGLELPVALRRK